MRAPITSLAQLRQAMATDEREHLEFKSAEKPVASKELFKYCVALANEGGGSLVFGVTDQSPRRIVGTDSFSELNKIKKRLLDTLRFRVDVFEISTPEGRVLSFFSPPRHQLCGTAGATISEFENVLPNKTRPQINALLQRMKKSGRIRVEGRTKGARWHLVAGENRPIGSD